ncbi:hypothetical protein LY474_08680 [Myxococcus stipitatus]|uniref:hypothetical protein n=1 Tax=Myxococcus stipitatus TaxID=83455 RepID=UPI001F1C6A60|nr:hypothetical protein [Myxococcus stipitatus]MCE9667883.1 hypothetical protein [Myxococcus stipitatus]
MQMKWIAAAGLVASLLTGCGGPMDESLDGVPVDQGGSTELITSEAQPGEVQQMTNQYGQCCNALCKGTMTRYFHPGVTDGNCTPFMRGYCADKGGLFDAWWGAC